MISAKRIVAIFRQRGGSEEFTNPVKHLTPEQLAYLENVSAGPPLIAKVSSENEWFALTKSLLVLKGSTGIRTVHLDEICAVDIPKADFLNRFIKVEGGNLDVELRDGSTLRFKVEPGGPYFGLLNVLMRIATINRRQSPKVKKGNKPLSPMTNDRRPTTLQ